jgi:phosphatidate phosphatase PAH1
MKTLKTKTVNIVTAWNNLRRLSPREFATVEEMETTMGVVGNLADSVSSFTKLLKEESDKITSKQSSMSSEDYSKAINALNAQITEMELKTGKNVVSCEMEDATFNSFFQLFEKHGKNWFGTVEEYLSFRKEINETNQQAKANA